MADEEKDKITEAEGQSAAVAREGAPKENNAGTQTAVADNNANATAQTGNPILAANPADANAGVKESNNKLATTITNEYGEPIYIDGRLNTGAPQKEGAGANERFAQANYHNPTPEEIEKQEKEYRNKRFWAALNDGIASLSNLYFTTQYAPNSFDPNNLATDKLRERYDKLKKDRDDQKDKWFNAVMQGRKMDEDLEAGKRASRLAYYQLQQQQKENEKNRINNLQINLANNAAKAAENAANRQSAETVAQINANGRIAAERVRAAGKGDDGYYYIEDEDGNVIYKTKDFNKYKARGQQLDVWVDEKTDTNTDRTATGTVTNPGYKQTQGQSKTGGYTKPVPVNKK